MQVCYAACKHGLKVAIRPRAVCRQQGSWHQHCSKLQAGAGAQGTGSMQPSSAVVLPGIRTQAGSQGCGSAARGVWDKHK